MGIAYSGKLGDVMRNIRELINTYGMKATVADVIIKKKLSKVGG